MLYDVRAPMKYVDWDRSECVYLMTPKRAAVTGAVQNRERRRTALQIGLKHLYALP